MRPTVMRTISPLMLGQRVSGASRRQLGRGAGALAVLVGLLVLFHVFLLWRRIVDASILSPRVLLNWLAALLLLVALAWMRRRGQSVVRSRGALIFWLLVLLLHAGPDLEPAPGLPPSGAETLPSPSVIFAAIVWTAVLGVALDVVSARARARRAAVSQPPFLAADGGYGWTVAPRPPPLVSVF